MGQVYLNITSGCGQHRSGGCTGVMIRAITRTMRMMLIEAIRVVKCIKEYP